MSTVFIPTTDMFFGYDSNLGRIGVICTTAYMYVYMYRKSVPSANKLVKIDWGHIDRLEHISQEYITISFKHIQEGSNLVATGDFKMIIFRCEHATLLIAKLLNMKVIKKCDKLRKFLTNRQFYKPKQSTVKLDYPITEDLFQEQDPEKIPLIEL